MSKYKARYDKDGKAYEWQDGVLVWIRPDLQDPVESLGVSAAVVGDIPDFVSTIDGTVVRGRSGLRDHCARHNVTPMEELKGLPPKTTVTPYQPTRQEREATKRTMHQIADQRGYFRNH